MFLLNFSAPFKTYHNDKNYLVRRQQDPSDSMNAPLYDDTPIHPRCPLGPLYRSCPVCLKNIPVHEIITLHIHHHIPHYTCPPCLNFLLSRGYKKCPVCQHPHLYFRLEASRIHPSTLAQATPTSQPAQRRPSPRRRPRQNIRHFQTEE